MMRPWFFIRTVLLIGIVLHERATSASALFTSSQDSKTDSYGATIRSSNPPKQFRTKYLSEPQIALKPEEEQNGGEGPYTFLDKERSPEDSEWEIVREDGSLVNPKGEESGDQTKKEDDDKDLFREYIDFLYDRKKNRKTIQTANPEKEVGSDALEKKQTSDADEGKQKRGKSWDSSDNEFQRNSVKRTRRTVTQAPIQRAKMGFRPREK